MARRRAKPRGGVPGPHASPGAGSVYPIRTGRDAGAWRGAAWATLPDGTRKRVFVTGADEANTRARLTVRLADAEGRTPPADDSALTVSQWVARWMAAELRGRRRASSWDAYLARAAHIKRHLDTVPLRELTAPQVRRMVTLLQIEAQPNVSRRPKPLSPVTAGRVLSLLHAAVRAAVRDGLLDVDPLLHVVPPRSETTQREVYTEAELRRLLVTAYQARHPFALLYEVAATVGLRRGEVIGIRWQDLDLDAGILSVQVQRVRDTTGAHESELKTRSSRRRIGLPAALLARLRTHQEAQRRERMAGGPAWQAEDAVFTHRRNPVPPGVPSEQLVALCRRAGVPYRPLHALRRSVATHMVARGEPINAVAELLGHSNAAITWRAYAHVVPGVSTEAVRRHAEAISPAFGYVDADVDAEGHENHAC